MDESLPKKRNPFLAFIDRFFMISERGSSISRELLGGAVIFLAMFYILPLNSNMLSGDWASLASATATNVRTTAEGIREILLYGDTWATVAEVNAAVFAATAISAGIATIFMGLIGKLPIGLASGLGLNSLIAYTVLLNMQFSVAQAMAVVFVDGLLFFIVSVTPLRKWLMTKIPKSLKFAISAGIGFFIAFLGFANCGIVVGSTSTPVAFGDLTSGPTLMGLVGIALVLVIVSLPQNNKVCAWISKFGVIISILLMALICGTIGTVNPSSGFSPFYSSDYSFSSLGNISKVSGIVFLGFDAFLNPMSYVLAFALLFMDFFDTAGTFVAVEASTGILDENGNPKEGFSDRNAMIVDAGGTLLGAVLGTTTVTSFVESTSGVGVGSRTGLTAVSTGLLFLLSLLVYPLLSAFSTSAVTSLALVYVGIAMFKNLEKIEWQDPIALASGFLTILVMIITYSISDGIAAGFISYSLMRVVSLTFSKNDVPIAVCSLFMIGIYIMQYSTGIM